MPWTDRLIEAAYTSPSGTRRPFSYEDVTVTIEKKTTAFEFPDADGTYIQDQGVSGRRIPLQCILYGTDYDQAANEFMDLLSERGVGRLEHPVYGVRDVVPFGPIKRSDRLKSGSNQAVITVTFWETIGVVYPTTQGDPASQVITAVDEYNVSASEAFDAQTSLESTVEKASLKGSYQLLLDSVAGGLESIAKTQEDVESQFNAVKDSINNSIDVLIGEPLTLAFQSVILMQAPSRAQTSITARLDAYENLLDIITDQAAADPGLNSEASNKFHSDDLFSSTYITGSVLSVVNNLFITKSEALSAADAILTQLDELIVWREANFASLGEIDTGEAYQQLSEAVSLAAGFLVEISFSLKQERILVLDRNRTLIDLVAELYGATDSEYDFFINSNNLSGSEILELQAGREILYYV
jgi:hypothetical protein